MSPSLDELVKQGEGDQDAIDLGDGIFMSSNIANSYLVTTADGDMMINTGTDFEATAIKTRFCAGEQRPVAGDHVHPGPSRSRGRVELSSRGRRARRSRRRTTPTCASTGDICTRSTCGGS